MSAFINCAGVAIASPSRSITFRHSRPRTSVRGIHRLSRLCCSYEEAVLVGEEELDKERVVEGNGVGDVEIVAEEIDLDPPGRSEENEHRISRYQAVKKTCHAITEGARPLSEYMTLPVSQYSVLDAEKVERLDDDTFRVQTSTVSFFKIKMTPVMTLTVRPHDTGCEVRLLDCTLEGSQVAVDANERFACYMRNYVSYVEDEETRQLKLTGDCIVQIAGIVPRWLNAVVSIRAINGVGRNMLHKILDLAMPRFLIQLEKDYLAWAAGDDSRSPMSTGDSFGLNEEVITATED